MHLQPATNKTKRIILALSVAAVICSYSANAFAGSTTTINPLAAATAPTSSGTQQVTPTPTKVFDQAAAQAGNQMLGAATQQITSGITNGVANTFVDEKQKAADRANYLGKADDPNSLLSKATSLANQASEQEELKNYNAYDTKDEKTPPSIENLQMINQTQGGADGIVDDIIDKKVSADMRRDAQKEAALSYGARGGLAKRSYHIMEKMRDYEGSLDKVFDFRSLLIKAPSGLLIEPPIIRESQEALVIKDDGNEAAVAQEVFDINKQARIVSAPRDWRTYLLQKFSTDVPPPPKVLWPKNEAEQIRWNDWVEKGWKAGVEQAEKIFELNTNRLISDYRGMVKYRMLLAQGMISSPYAMHEERGVTGDDKQMRVGDTALKITGPSQFIIGANAWKPADR